MMARRAQRKLWRRAGRAALFFVLAQQAAGQPLPAWTPEDLARVKNGDIIAGAGLLVDSPADAPQIAPDPAVPPLPEPEPEPPYDPKVIPGEFLSAYFATAPQSYLIDPQHLLSRQETLDREGFLEYHAAESTVDIRLYLFDAQQEIPAQYSPDNLARERYAKSDLTAVVYCFLGAPSRNMLAFGGREAGHLETAEIRRTLEHSLLKALEKSDPAAQVEAFVVELSIKLYWMEKSMADAKAAAAAAAMPRDGTPENHPAAEKPAGAMAKIQPYLLYLAVGGGGVGLMVAGAAGVYLLWRRSRRYHFPVLEIPRRLGAEYAAGIGAVIAFNNKHGSPSSQRDQVPDYLMRM